MKRFVLMILAVLLAAALLVPAAHAASSQSLVGGYANYTTKQSGNINETFSFIINSFNSSDSSYTVNQNLGSSTGTVNVGSDHLYKAFPVLSTNSSTAVVGQIAHSPLNSFGFVGLIEHNSTATLTSQGSGLITVPAGTFKALEFNDTATSYENGTYTSLSITCFIDSATGVILTLLIQVNSNGTNLYSSSVLMSSNVAQNAVSGWNLPLIVAGAGIALISVFVAVIVLQRKK